MKKIVLLLVFIYSSLSLAYKCPPSIKKKPNAELHKFLSQYKNLTDVYGCKIEVIVCQKTIGNYDEFAPIGEILIKDRFGNEGYVQLRLSDQPNKFIKSKFESGRGYMSYILYDYSDESIEGKIQKWDLDIFRKPKSNEIRELSLGIYSHNRQLNQPNGNDSRWFLCKKDY